MRRTPFESLSHSLLGLPEAQLVRKIVDEWRTLYDLFDFVVQDALGRVPRSGWDYLFFCQIPRTDIGLPRLGQPGDIDVLIVPVRDNRAYVGAAAAIEVKRLALRGPNWARNVDRYGVTQAHGLASAGFPYVGILHLIVCAEGPPENQRTYEMAKVLDGDLLHILGPKAVDATGWLAAQRQYARLQTQAINPVVGINCIAIDDTIGDEGRGWVHSTVPRGRPARRNPNVSATLLQNLGHYIQANQAHIRPRAFDVQRRSLK